MNTPSSLGQRIVTAREAKNLKQNELAAQMNMSPTTINFYEKDKRNPKPHDLAKISTILGVSSDYLLGLESREASEVRLSLRHTPPGDASQLMGLPGGSFSILSSPGVPYETSRSRSPAQQLAASLCPPGSSGRRQLLAVQLLQLLHSASDKELQQLLSIAEILTNDP